MKKDVYEHQRSMEILQGLAMEIQQMDEDERRDTLKWLARGNGAKNGQRFWYSIIQHLLVNPESVPKALQLARQELSVTNFHLVSHLLERPAY